MQELTEMLGFRPYQFYYYTWKYVSPICMAVLMTASIIQLGVSPPGYSAWIREEVSTVPIPALLCHVPPTWPSLVPAAQKVRAGSEHGLKCGLGVYLGSTKEQCPFVCFDLPPNNFVR